MAGELLGPLILTAFAGLFVWVAIAALRKARRRNQDSQDSRGHGSDIADSALPAEFEAPSDSEAASAPEPDVSVPVSAPSVAATPIVVDAALKSGLARTQNSLVGKLNALFAARPSVDASMLGELEEALLTADVGVKLTSRLVESVKEGMSRQRIGSAEALRSALHGELLSVFPASAPAFDVLAPSPHKPRVILFVGVNGVGKTTTIGKIASLCRSHNLNVVLGAGDTFRAAAVEQLGIWGDRVGAKVIRGEPNSDPASVAFNAVDHAVKAGADIALLDTAGRLHTKTELMDEIKKVKRSIGKARAQAPDETWLVLDATTGQNAMQQAREFHQALGLTGVILTKLDGTAKGGVVVAIADALQIPVRFVGVGEKAEDLRPFESKAFVDALLAPTQEGIVRS